MPLDRFVLVIICHVSLHKLASGIARILQNPVSICLECSLKHMIVLKLKHNYGTAIQMFYIECTFIIVVVSDMVSKLQNNMNRRQVCNSLSLVCE